MNKKTETTFNAILAQAMFPLRYSTLPNRTGDGYNFGGEAVITTANGHSVVFGGNGDEMETAKTIVAVFNAVIGANAP